MYAPNLVHEIYDLYLAYGYRKMKYTTCTRRMADVDSVESVLTKYTLCIVGDIWSNVCTKFGTRSIRHVPGECLTYDEVDNLYRTYGQRTQRIVRVYHVYPMNHRNVCTKFGPRNLRPVPGVWLS